MVLGYSGCYLCRSNFSVFLGEIAEELTARGMTAEEARLRMGQVATLGVLAYALGKFVTGSIADFVGGRRNVLLGMLGSVLFTILFALGGGLPVFSLAWFGNRAVQSLCWTGMVKVTGRWFSYSAYGSAMGVVSLSYLFGDAAARAFMSQLIEFGLSWREVFYACAGVLFVLTVLCWLWLRESPREVGHEEPGANPLNVYGMTSDVDEIPQSLGKLLAPLLGSPAFLTVCALSLGLTLLRETFNLWTPTYFTDVVGSSQGEAAALSTVFPLLGGASVLVAGWLGDQLGPTGRAIVILAGCALAGVVMWVLGSFDFSGSAIFAGALIGLVSFLMLGPYSYLAGAISLDLGGKRGAATACGIIDGVGYLGSMLAGDTVARLSNSYGWSGVFRALALVAVATSLAGLVFYVLERKKLPAAGVDG
jgi:OPA family glycerol-3-phosphate transporter-like MFS transporter